MCFDFFGAHLNDTEISDHVEIRDYDLFWAGEPLVSDIKSSKLIISGPARETFLEVAPEGRQCNPPYFIIDGEIPAFTEQALPWSCAAQFDREQERSPDRFLCILVRRRVIVSTGYRTETFLILEPATTIAPHEKWRRIGLGMFRGHSDRFSSDTRKTISLI